MLELDGSRGEGGGSVLRYALALSLYTGKPFRITNIRADRPEPGMKMQHLKALNAAQRLSNAKVEGNVTGSEEVSFHPEGFDGGSLEIDIETAGSVTLLLQTLMLPCCFTLTRHKITVNGGTDVKWSPPWDYFQNVFIPHLRKFADIETSLERRGYYPAGGGRVQVAVEGNGEPDSSIDLREKGELFQVKGVSHASNDLQDRDVAERQARNAEVTLSGLDCPVSLRREYASTESTGSGVSLRAIHGGPDGVDMDNPVILGANTLGEPSTSAETVGEDAANKLQRELDTGAPVDKHLADQLIPYIAVAGGSIRVTEVTKHTLSHIYVSEEFLPVTFTIEGNQISCHE